MRLAVIAIALLSGVADRPRRDGRLGRIGAASTSGRPASTPSATRGGGAARRPTARTRT